MEYLNIMEDLTALDRQDGEGARWKMEDGGD